MKTIQLANSELMAIVDDEDYERILQYNTWFAQVSRHTTYAITWKGEGMHRVVMGLYKYDRKVCMHLDDNGLHNWRSNLKIGTHKENLSMVQFRIYKDITHCPQGHEYAGYNLYVRPGTNRKECRECHRLQEWRRRNAGR